MSLLEDIFLQDEANEAQELERVIEGEEFEERLRSDSDNNSEKEDEAVEDKRKVEPNTAKAKRIIKNPRFVLNPARLTGPRGIQVIPEHFKDFKFKGKGHEREDLDLILKKLEHWAYRLYPKFNFEDCLKKIETLGKKRPVMVHLHKIRSDQFISEETVVQKDSSDEETPAVQPEEDEFDRLLQQQIDLARSTPAPNSVKKLPPTNNSPIDNRLLNISKATSSPSISEEQRERMLRCRRLAEERRLARLKNATDVSVIPIININETDTRDAETGKLEIGTIKRHNRSNVIDSSDDEDNTVSYVNESVAVDIHSNNKEASCLSNKTNNENDNNKITDIIQVNKSKHLEFINETENILEGEYDTQNHNAITNSETIFNIDTIGKDENAVKESDFTKEKHEVIKETYIDIEQQNELISEENIDLDKENEVMPQSDREEKKMDEIKTTNMNTESTEKDQELSKMAQADELMDVDFSEEF